MTIQSPFPGMDPYLEQYWQDVHQRLVLYGCDQVQAHLPRDLRARVQERVFVQAEDSTGRNLYPDIRVTERRREGGPAAATAAGVAVAEPLLVHVSDEPVTESFVEIFEAGSGQRVVTVIEVLSLANKQPGEGRDLYQRKQRELYLGHVGLVEIDLLRAGQWTVAVPRNHIPREERTPYVVCVQRGWRPRPFEVYPIRVRERLPTIRVPLRETDTDAPLDLQALIELAYRNGRYDDIDYRVPPEPALEPEDAAWADELLRSKGLR